MGEYNDPISSGEALSAAAPSGAVAVGSAGADAGIIEPPLSRSLHVAMLPARIAALPALGIGANRPISRRGRPCHKG